MEKLSASPTRQFPGASDRGHPGAGGSGRKLVRRALPSLLLVAATVGLVGCSQDQPAATQSCDAQGRCDGATASTPTSPGPDTASRQPAAVVLSKGAPKQTSFCTDASCAFVKVELVNFDPGSCWTFDLDSDEGPFAAPKEVCVDSAGHGVEANWWVYGVPNTHVTATVNGVSATPLRW